MIPQTIGRYKIKDQLGAGGMGIVYRAYDPHLLREVALKMLFRGEFRRLSKTKQTEVLARFQQEAKIIASLHHTAIIPVYDFGWENGEPFIVMPLMSGGGLDDRLEAGPLALDKIVRIFDSLAPALDKVHQRGIVHRDLKPSNILFDEENQPYLADFGIARLTEETMRLSKTATPLGTPAYMSPEQARGDKDIDQRSDIYSLGGMLFKMLTGERPYHRVHPYVLPHFHMNEPPPRLDDDDLSIQLPTAYQAIIDCAMAKKKEERYATASEMTAALKTVVERGRVPKVTGVSNEQTPSESFNNTRAIHYFKQGDAAYNQGRYNRAIVNYNDAIHLTPHYATAYKNRGNAYYSKGEFELAIADYNQALGLNRDYTCAYLDRGLAYYDKGEFDLAISDYSQALSLKPNQPKAYHNRGVAYADKGELDLAIADYNEALRFNPNDAIAYKNRGNAYYNKGNYEQAIANYNEAQRLNPNYAAAYLGRGVAHELRGSKQQAIADYQNVVRLNNDPLMTRLARENLERLQQEQGMGSKLKRWFFG